MIPSLSLSLFLFIAFMSTKLQFCVERAFKVQCLLVLVLHFLVFHVSHSHVFLRCFPPIVSITSQSDLIGSSLAQLLIAVSIQDRSRKQYLWRIHGWFVACAVSCLLGWHGICKMLHSNQDSRISYREAIASGAILATLTMPFQRNMKHPVTVN